MIRICQTVMLHTDTATEPGLATNKDAVYYYVQEAFIEQFQVKSLTPVGFYITYTQMMQKEVVERLQIRKISDLSNYLNVQ